MSGFRLWFYFPAGYYAASVTEAAVRGIYGGELARGYALDPRVAFYDIFPVCDPGEPSGYEFGGVAVLERYFRGLTFLSPRIEGYPVHLVEMDGVAILFFSVVAARDIDDIVGDALLHDIPRAAAESEAFALAYGVKPVAAVLSEFLSGLYFHDSSGLFTQMAADEIVVVDFPEKAYSLAVAAVGVGHVDFAGYAAHFRFRQVAYRKHEMAQLAVGDSREKIRLVT